MTERVFTKADKGKPMLSYLPWGQLEKIANVMDYGAQKYGRFNYELNTDSHRYISAALRHISDHLQGNERDFETGQPALIHALCSLLIACETIERNNECDKSDVLEPAPVVEDE